MTTLQEKLEKDFSYRTTEIKLANDGESIGYNYRGKLFTNHDLDLRKYKDLETFILAGCDLSLNKLDLSECLNLKHLNVGGNLLTSLDFLNTLPNPEQLESLCVFNNNIEPTNISVFSKFVNLRTLMIGTMEGACLGRKKHNKFYGSLKAYQPLTKLEKICIEATDVDKGLEYLPFSLVKATQGGGKKVYRVDGILECRPHGNDAKCSAIQDQLRKYDYDIEAWQLAHPHLMYKARPELFFNTWIRSEWLSALRDKTNKTQEKLNECKKDNKPEDTKRIKRLEMKLDNLKLIQKDINNQNLIGGLEEKVFVAKENKATQTECLSNIQQSSETLSEYVSSKK